MNYQEYVEAAKKLVNRVDCFQAKIAEYAVAVCQIRHGGRSSEFYTLTNFAEDVGLPMRRLSRWVAIYKVSLSAGVKNPTKLDWTVASKVKQLEDMRIVSENHSTGTPRKKIKRLISNDTTKKTFQQIKNGDSQEFEFSKAFRIIQSSKKLVMETDLDLVDDRTLGLLMSYLDEMSDCINNYLTKKKKSKQ